MKLGLISCALYQAWEVRCAAFAATAALVVVTQGVDNLKFLKAPFEAAGALGCTTCTTKPACCSNCDAGVTGRLHEQGP
jgi:hypothetical protein